MQPAMQPIAAFQRGGEPTCSTRCGYNPDPVPGGGVTNYFWGVFFFDFLTIFPWAHLEARLFGIRENLVLQCSLQLWNLEAAA